MCAFIKNVCLLLLLYITTIAQFAKADLPVVDLSAQTLGQEELLEIPNSWRFYWQQYLFLGDSFAGGEPIGATLPWTTIPNKESGHPAHGFGTYALILKLPKRTEPNLALKMRRVKTAYALYIDEVLVGHTGNLANYPRPLTPPINKSGIVNIQVPIEKSEITILIHVSSMKYYRGGLDQPPQLSYVDTAHASKMRDILWPAFIAGALLFMGFYHLALWIKRKTSVTSLLFSVFSVAVGTRVFFTYKLAYLMFPNLTEDTMLWCETVLAYTALPFLHLFISSSFPLDANKYITRLSWVTWVAMMIVSFGTSLYTMSRALPAFEIYFIVILFHMLYMGFIAIRRKREGAVIFTIGFIIAIFAGIHDVLFYNGTIPGLGRAIFPFGVLIFVFAQFLLHSMRFSRAYRELEILTNTLELQVQERTKELSAAHQESKKAHEETKHLSNAITNLLEDERKSIARELHDDFGQSLRAAGHFAEAISRSLNKIEQPTDELKKSIANADQIASVLIDMYHKNRDLLRRLRPEIIDTLGLESAIEELLANYRRNDFKIDFKCDANVSSLGNKEKITIYRILQEAITNILKYADTKAFTVLLTETNEQIVFAVADNGKGFDVTTARGVGLISMRERMADIGGSIEVLSAPSAGTKIIAKFPKN